MAKSLLTLFISMTNYIQINFSNKKFMFDCQFNLELPVITLIF